MPKSASTKSPPPKLTPASAPSTSLSTSLVTARSLVLLQLLTRLLTFGLNQALVRLAPPEVLGTASIQFDLIASTILFLSREGIRTTLLRRPGPALARVPFYLGLVVSSAVVGVYLYSADILTKRQPGFYAALWAYVGAALLELAVEPAYVAAITSSQRDIKTRMRAEGGMAVVRTVLVFGCLVSGMAPLLGFGVGQLAGAVWLAIVYVRAYGLGSWVVGWVLRADTC